MQHSRASRLAVAVAFTVVGCSNPLRTSDDAVVQVSGYLRRPYVEEPVLTVHMDGKKAVLTAAQMAGLKSASIRTDRFGDVGGRVVLTSATGADTLADFTFTHHLQREYNHWVTVTVGVNRPIGMCAGEQTAIPLSGLTPVTGDAGGDSLFFSLGSMPKRAVC